MHFAGQLDDVGKPSELSDLFVKTFDFFSESGDGRNQIELLAVATNLNRGSLEVLSSSRGKSKNTLRGGLLASSAFPFVFRPRQTWEIDKRDMGSCRFVDAGVMDNLPLDEVTRYLNDRACNSGDLMHRPKTPHLVLAASLEPEVPRLSEGEAADHARDWVRLISRVKKLRYNKKSDSYARAQNNFRLLHEQFGGYKHYKRKKNEGEEGEGRSEMYPPLNLEVATVVPRWLCGTFAFHPMLGFRRIVQAASIAHGCASTLARLYLLASNPRTNEWARTWGTDPDQQFDATTVCETASEDKDGYERKNVKLTPNRDKRPGGCWFRNGRDCPFSHEVLPGMKGYRDDESIAHRSLELIHERCGDWRTHQAGWFH